MKRFFFAALLTGLLLILAATISLVLTGFLDTEITCGIRGGCRAFWGQFAVAAVGDRCGLDCADLDPLPKQLMHFQRH
jgi:hypothetical protein